MVFGVAALSVASSTDLTACGAAGAYLYIGGTREVM